MTAPAVIVIGEARADGQTGLEVDRWADEGGSLADERPRRTGAPAGAAH